MIGRDRLLSEIDIMHFLLTADIRVILRSKCII